MRTLQQCHQSLRPEPATVSCHPFEDRSLVLGGLIVAAHPQVDRCANAIGAHGSAFRIWNYSGMIPPIPNLPRVRNGRYAQMVGGGSIVTGRIMHPANAGAIPGQGMGVRIRNESRLNALAPALQQTGVDGVEMRRVRKKSLYLRGSSDMNHTPDQIRQQIITSSMNGRCTTGISAFTRSRRTQQDSSGSSNHRERLFTLNSEAKLQGHRKTPWRIGIETNDGAVQLGCGSAILP